MFRRVVEGHFSKSYDVILASQLSWPPTGLAKPSRTMWQIVVIADRLDACYTPF